MLAEPGIEWKESLHAVTRESGGGYRTVTRSSCASGALEVGPFLLRSRVVWVGPARLRCRARGLPPHSPGAHSAVASSAPLPRGPHCVGGGLRFLPAGRPPCPLAASRPRVFALSPSTISLLRLLSLSVLSSSFYSLSTSTSPSPASGQCLLCSRREQVYSRHYKSESVWWMNESVSG